MSFKFHHLNFCTDNLPRLTGFYKTLFELGTINDSAHKVISRERDDRAYTGKVDFLTDGDVEFHWAERDLDTGYKMKKSVNPNPANRFDQLIRSPDTRNMALRTGKTSKA